MRKLSVLLFLFSITCVAQENKGYRLSSFSLKISDYNPASIKEINDVSDISKRRVELDKSISQADFDKLCTELPWIKDLQIGYGSKEINNINAVSKLKGLERLEIRRLASAKTSPLDITPLATAKELHYLNLESTPFSSTEILKNLTKMEELDVSLCAINSLDFVKEMKELEILYLRGFKHSFENYEALVNCPLLEEIDLRSNKQATQENLQVLNKLSSLTVINLMQNRNITSLDFVSNLANLEELDAQWAINLSDISGLSSNEKLRRLKFSKSKVSDITALKNKKELFYLDISETPIVGFSALKELNKMKEIYLQKTAFSDVSLFSNASNLRTLYVDQTQVNTLGPLKVNEKLSTLSIPKTSITDLSPVLASKSLRSLTVSPEFPESELEKAKTTLSKLSVRIAK